MLQPCQPLVADLCGNAGCALSADATNRSRHIECQRKDQALIDSVNHLKAEGVLK